MGSEEFKLGPACRDCPLSLEPGPVAGFGPENASMMFVGEAPGAEEVDFPLHRPDRMKPFIGGAGRIHSSVCYSAGINRKDTFITNCVRCRPPRNRTPTDEECKCCFPYLMKEIEHVNPNVIVALGETALKMLTGKKGISTWRGVPTSGVGGRKIFPTWHPAFLARSQQNWPFVIHDYVRAAAQQSFPEIRRRPFKIVKGYQLLKGRYEEKILVEARSRGAVTFDLETTGLNPKQDKVLLLGLVTQPALARILYWGEDTKDLFQKIVDDPNIRLVGQNILYYDLPFIEEHNVDISKAWDKVFDTMVAFHLANASYGKASVRDQAKGRSGQGMEKDLSMIASCYTDMEYWKGRENYQADLLEVCGKDCIATDRAALDPVTGLEEELRALDMHDLYWKHVLPVHPVLYKMTKAGVRIDQEQATRWSFALGKQSEELERVLREEFKDPFLNLDSPKQLSNLLYNKMGLPVQMHHREHRPTVDATALEDLMNLAPENKILGSIIDVRLYRKLKSTYIDPFIPEGRVHPSFGAAKASTGRLNSWNPNAQNVPEYIRDIWIADDEECVLLVGDWSQIEWRLSMILSGDPVGLEMISSGVDSHRAVAADILGKRIEDVTPDERQSAKVIVYGLGYGRGAKSLSKPSRRQVGGSDRRAMPHMSIAWAESFIARFLGRFSTFARWREDNVQFVQEHNYLTNPFKRRRWWYTQEVTEVYNYPQQSTAADMMYDALILIDRQLPPGSSLRLTVHDEVGLNVPKHLAKETYQCVKECMEISWPNIVEASVRPDIVRRLYPNGWCCPVDLHFGHNWKQAKSKDPEDVKASMALEKELGL